ncbi:MAG: hypothetical protein CMN10_14780 [Roseobacter sp.]|nr:hypothetical protein [Roseobacter sp.]MBV49820.1 hypothetical protein [Roseobacter sp.]
MSRYRAWWRTLFESYSLETGFAANQDVIASLMRMARWEGERDNIPKLHLLRHVILGGMKVSDLKYVDAPKLNKTLSLYHAAPPMGPNRR